MNPNGAATPFEATLALLDVSTMLLAIDGSPAEPPLTVTDPFDCVNNETYFETCWRLDYRPTSAALAFIAARDRWAVRWA